MARLNHVPKDHCEDESEDDWVDLELSGGEDGEEEDERVQSSANADKCRRFRHLKRARENLAAQASDQAQRRESRASRTSGASTRSSSSSKRSSSMMQKRVGKAAAAVDHEMRGLDRSDFFDALVSHKRVIDATEGSSLLRTSKIARAQATICEGISHSLNQFTAREQTSSAMQVKDTVAAAAVASMQGTPSSLHTLIPIQVAPAKGQSRPRSASLGIALSVGSRSLSSSETTRRSGRISKRRARAIGIRSRSGWSRSHDAASSF